MELVNCFNIYNLEEECHRQVSSSMTKQPVKLWNHDLAVTSTGVGVGGRSSLVCDNTGSQSLGTLVASVVK